MEKNEIVRRNGNIYSYAWSKQISSPLAVVYAPLIIFMEKVDLRVLDCPPPSQRKLFVDRSVIVVNREVS